MATPIDISEIQPSQVRSAGWATEATLASLVGHAKGSEDILGKIAAHFKIDISEVKRTNQALETGNRDRSRGFADLGRKYENGASILARSIKGLESGLATALKAGAGDASSPFMVISSGARSISSAFEKVSPAVSAFAGALAVGSSTLALLINQLSNINDTMRGLYATGVRIDNGFQGLAASASDAGLSAQQFAEILTKNANVTVGLGARRTTQLMGMFAQATSNGADFVMTNQEAQEAFMDTMGRMQTAGLLRTMSDQQVTRASTDYLHNLNDLSASTGRNRDEIRRTSRAMQQMPQTYTAMRRLPEEARKNFLKAQDGLAASFGETAPQLMDELAKYMTGGVGMMSREFQLMFSGVGGGIGQEMQRYAQAMNDGTASEEDRQRLVERIQTIDQANLDAMARAGRDNPEIAAMHARIVAMQQATQAEYDNILRRRSLSQEDRDKEDAARRIAEEKSREQQKAFNELNSAMGRFSNTMKSMVADLTPILIPALEGMASIVTFLSSALKTVLETISAWTGGGQTGGVVAVATVAAAAILATSVFRVGMGRLMGRLTGMGAGGGASALGRGSAGSGIGGMLQGMGAGLSGLSTGLASLAKPQALIGLGAVTLAIIGIATAIRIAGPALEPFGKMIKEVFFGVAEVVRGVGDGIRSVLEGIGTAATGLGEGISKALGGVAEVFRSIGTAIKDAFGGVADLVRSIGDSIREAFAGAGIVISNMGTSITDIVDSFSRLKTAGIDATTRQISELSTIPAGNMVSAADGIRLMRQALEGFTPGLLEGLSQGIGALFTADPAEKLGRLASVGSILGESATHILTYTTALKGILSLLDDTNMARFTNLGMVFDRLANVFRQGINSRTITPLVQAVTSLIKGVQEVAPAAAGGGAPVITTDQLNARTILYYDQSMAKFNQMADALERANEFLDRMVNDSDTHTRDMINAIEASGTRVR
jgi:hypothetical protein